MPFNRIVTGGIALAVGCLLVFSAPAAAGPKVAAVQVALKRIGLYSATVDGVRGPLTKAAIVHFQRRRGLAVDGVVGPRTRRRVRQARPAGVRLADHEAGRPRVGRRRDAVHPGAARLPAGRDRRGVRADDRHGSAELPARIRAERRRAGRASDHLARSGTDRASRGTPGGTTPVSGPVRLLRPVPGRIGDGFGAPREGGRTHTGIDFPVPSGTRIGAAGVGVVEFAGWNTRRLREPRGRPAQARLHHLVRPHVAHRGVRRARA